MLEFYFICLLYLGLIALRFYLSYRFTRGKGGQAGPLREKDLTILQSLSSDVPELKETLKANLSLSHDLDFIWVLDREDQEAQDLVRELLDETGQRSRVQLLFAPPAPQGLHPDSFKYQMALDLIKRPYTMILDQSLLLDLNSLQTNGGGKEQVLAQGLVYQTQTQTKWERLYAAGLNDRAFLAQLPLAVAKQLLPSSPICLLLPSQLLHEAGFWQEVEGYFHPLFAIEQAAAKRGYELKQSLILAASNKKLGVGRIYLEEMTKQFLFYQFYLQKKREVLLLVLAVLPSLLNVSLLLWTLFLPSYILISYLSVLLAKEVIFYLYRSRILSDNLPLSEILFHLISEWFLPFFLIKVLVDPPVLRLGHLKVRIDEEGHFQEED